MIGRVICKLILKWFVLHDCIHNFWNVFNFSSAPSFRSFKSAFSSQKFWTGVLCNHHNLWENMLVDFVGCAFPLIYICTILLQRHVLIWNVWWAKLATHEIKVVWDTLQYYKGETAKTVYNHTFKTISKFMILPYSVTSLLFNWMSYLETYYGIFCTNKNYF